MKTLVILAHPNIDESVINSAWINNSIYSKEDTTVHNIYRKYPTGKIDVEFEQQLVSNHEAIILQFPFYWFSTPPLLKQWLDDVLAPGFAYGPNADDRKLTNMPIGFAVSAGIKSEDYKNKGRYKYSIKELLAPLHATVSYIGAKPLEPLVFFGAEYSPAKEDIASSVEKYSNYLADLKNNTLAEFSM